MSVANRQTPFDEGRSNRDPHPAQVGVRALQGAGETIMSAKIADLTVEEFKELIVGALVESERFREMVREIALSAADEAIEDHEVERGEGFGRMLEESRAAIRAGDRVTLEEYEASILARELPDAAHA